MSRLPLRVSLLILCLGAIAGAAFLIWSSTRTAAVDAASARQFELNARAAAIDIADLRAAQQSYVAAGQGQDFWFERVNAIRSELDEKIAALRASATSPDAVAGLQAAASALQDFAQMDLRARDYTRNRQLTLASDMVFADGFELTKKAGDAVAHAILAEQTARDAGSANAQRQQALTAGGAAAVALLGLLLLVPVPRRPVPPAIAATPILDDIPTIDDIPPLPRTARSDPADFPLAARRIEPELPVTREPEPPKIELERLASLCGDLARVTDTRALPPALERTAAILEASGIVLWIADPDGRELSPILMHGYPPQLALRLGTIARDAENVTASAYRTGLMQTVKGDATSAGAIAVPLVSASGCIGVMAAEVKNGVEHQPPVLAAASIIAAQLATLVGPPSARAKAEAAG